LDIIGKLRISENAMSSAIERYRLAINRNSEECVYAAVSESLLWIVAMKEWYMKNETALYNEEIKVNNDITGLMAPYNIVKHIGEYIKLHKPNPGLSFPTAIPFRLGPSLATWEKIPESVNLNHKNQIIKYNTYLAGQNIEVTLNDTEKFFVDLNKRVYEIK
jgi:hypothetical protein